VIIKFLTYYEKDYTSTNREASLAIKSIIAQMINSIVIPVITAYEIKNNVYETSGLVDNIFMLGVTTSLVPPIMVFVDPYNIFMKVMRCIKSRPSTQGSMQRASWDKPRRNTTCSTRASNSSWATTTSMW
jgi:hypothetical protein